MSEGSYIERINDAVYEALLRIFLEQLLENQNEKT